MILSKILKNGFLILAACLVLTACATKKEVTTDTTTSDTTTTDTTDTTTATTAAPEISGQMQGDTYVGDDTVKYLADGVPDRVFFATNESILTTAVVNIDSFVAKKTLSGTPSAKYLTVSSPTYVSPCI